MKIENTVSNGYLLDLLVSLLSDPIAAMIAAFLLEFGYFDWEIVSGAENESYSVACLLLNDFWHFCFIQFSKK